MEQTGEETPSEPSLGRRGYLRRGAALTALATGASTMWSTAVSAAAAFAQTVDAVADLGMDPAGSKPIDAALDRAIDSDKLIEFPPGTYRFTKPHTVESTLGLRGTGDSRGDVRFIPPQGYNDYLLVFELSRKVLIENLTIDRRTDYETSTGMKGRINGTTQVRNVEYAGWTPSGPQMLAVGILDRAAELTVDGFYRTGPSEHQDYPDGSIDILITRSSHGTATLRNIVIHNGGENGIYAEKSQGIVHLEDLYFKNVVHTAIRVAGTNSSVKNCTVIMDTEQFDPANRNVRSTYSGNSRIELNRGIWVHTADVAKKTGPLIEDCDVIIGSAPGAIAGILTDNRTGGSRIRNCRVRCDEPDVTPILADSVDTSEAGRPYAMELDGVSVVGSAWNGAAIDITGRDNSTITNCCVQSAESTTGIRIADSTGCSITNTNVNVSGGGPAIITPNSSVSRRRITTKSTCPKPSEGRPSSRRQPDPGLGAKDRQIPSRTHRATVTGAGSGAGTQARYRLLTTGKLYHASNQQADGSDAISQTNGQQSVTGTVGATDTDEYRFTGLLTEIRWTAPIRLTINGQDVPLGQ